MPQKQEFRVRMEPELVEWLDGQAKALEVSRNAFFNQAIEQFQVVDELQKQAKRWLTIAVVAVVLAGVSIVGAATYGVINAIDQPTVHTVQKPIGAIADTGNNELHPSVARFATNLQANLARNQEKRRLDAEGRRSEVMDRLRQGTKGHTDGKLEDGT